MSMLKGVTIKEVPYHKAKYLAISPAPLHSAPNKNSKIFGPQSKTTLTGKTAIMANILSIEKVNSFNSCEF